MICRPRWPAGPLPQIRSKPVFQHNVQCRAQVKLDLAPWQRRRLEEAARLGKGKTEIVKLAGDTQLTRDEVLTFLKWWRSLSKQTKDSFTEATVEAEKAFAERKAIREANKAEKSQHAWKTFQEVNDLKRERKRSSQGSMTSRQINFLEKVFHERTRRPSNDMVSEICRLEGLDRKTVTQWFELRRSEK